MKNYKDKITSENYKEITRTAIVINRKTIFLAARYHR
jgi:hypothetical protein